MRHANPLFNTIVLLLGLVSACVASAEPCDNSAMKLQVLGSGGPELIDGRASTSYLIWIHGKARILVDLGSGAMANYGRSGATPEDLDAVLFTHFHVDHSADFPALIKSLSFTDYDKELKVYGPGKGKFFPGVKQYVDALFNRKSGAYAYLADYADFNESSSFKIIPTEVAPHGKQILSFQLPQDIKLAAIVAQHGSVPALSWSIEAAGCKLTVSGDTSNSAHTLELLAKDSDILVAHNAAGENDPDPVARLLHMMPSEIGRLAKAANVKQLVLSHRMKRTLGKEAQTVAAIRVNYDGPIQFAEDRQIFQMAPPHQVAPDRTAK